MASPGEELGDGQQGPHEVPNPLLLQKLAARRPHLSALPGTPLSSGYVQPSTLRPPRVPLPWGSLIPPDGPSFPGLAVPVEEHLGYLGALSVGKSQGC